MRISFKIKQKGVRFFFINYYIFLFFTSSCNPIPQKDTHPELPYLCDLLADTSKFNKIIDADTIFEIEFLKSDKIVIKPSDYKYPIKIITENKDLIFEKIWDSNIPFYIDSLGNVYCNHFKYYYPDYKKSERFKAVYIKDSLIAYGNLLDKKYVSADNEKEQATNDSISLKKYLEYEKKILDKYGITEINYEDHIFKIYNNQIIVWNDDLYKNDFIKKQTKIDFLDESILFKYGHSGGHFGGSYPIYLNYYILDNKYKFKDEDNPWATKIKLKNKTYVYTSRCGLYSVK